MAILTSGQQAMIELFQKPAGAELAGDLETTMNAMSHDPHLHNVPTMIEGVGRDGVRAFYRDHLVGKFFPPDVGRTNVSRTVGMDQIVDKVVIRSTHTTPMLPRVPPTGKPVEMAVVVLAGVLVQIGLLNPSGLPVSGAESPRKMLDPKLPARPM